MWGVGVDVGVVYTTYRNTTTSSTTSMMRRITAMTAIGAMITAGSRGAAITADRTIYTYTHVSHTYIYMIVDRGVKLIHVFCDITNSAQKQIFTDKIFMVKLPAMPCICYMNLKSCGKKFFASMP